MTVTGKPILVTAQEPDTKTYDGTAVGPTRESTDFPAKYYAEIP